MGPNDLSKSARRVLGRIRIEGRKVYLRFVNHLSGRPVASGIGPVVSLTSHGRRTKSVFLALESIAAGSLQPRRLILWLGTDSAAELPGSLRRLVGRGLEVRVTKDFGPHTKYYPYLASETSFRVPLVTADDDILYPRDWLSLLDSSYSAFPDDVSCHRAARIQLNRNGIAPYLSWPLCRNVEPSILNFATGVSGVLYPPKFLELLKESGTRFVDVAPKADDIWLHRMAVQGNIAVRQVSAESRHFDEVFRADASGLMHQNAVGGGNDHQISRTYSGEDVIRLRDANAAEGRA